ncbi:hypothetical protein JX265_009571 [Neoarthrinium moseri]|uniref:HTH CENPB-type domain-containing protein n=1 Tax=Neoarthrinium moseri TaxID=1658444 RepID=A0A9P9WG31_9PEZI|nr:uncharacterized protein JN550_013119 [Neoarthrinium moseri]KAI1857607.1 hypothetical protein JN550_013119 [Neoarthrinium moseri]KAI1861604.1 hypothetical protein JX265_009571 [Neoarthrinium moseri]
MIGSSSGIDQDSHLASDHTFASDQWVGMNPYNQMPMSNYGNEYYMTSVTHGLPSESINAGHMGPPPVPQQIHHQQSQHYASQLPHLMIPTQQSTPPVSWPSLRTNPSQTYSSPPVPIPPPSVTQPLKQQPKLPSITTSTPRKTLTNEDRRRMCQFAEDNPKVKQNEIGLKFGVERSTVSKVLRKKDQYLNQDDRSSSPIKKPKGKNAGELERTLVNWARNQQKKGVVVTDEELETQARAFFAGTGSSENPVKIITRSWLEKFKQKNGMGPGKLIRRASETAIPDNTQLSADSPILSASQTPGGISPASPVGQSSPAIVSATPSKEGNDTSGAFADFESGQYKHNQSSTSLHSAVTDPSSSFSGSAFSPASQFTFSPDPNSGLFEPNRMSLEASNFQRPRSQTFPTLDIEFAQQQPSEPPTPKYSASTTAPSSALESPAHEIAAPTFGMDATISPTLHHSRSSSSLGGRSTNTPILPSAVASSPGSPTQDDARRAADTLLSFMQHMPTGLVNHDEYAAILRLTEKLRLHQQHQSFKATVPTGMGGLSRIPEGDTEMSSIAPHLMKHELKDDAMITG